VGAGNVPGDKPKKADHEIRDQYPKVEEKLKNLQATLKALEGKNPAAVAAAPSQFNPDGLDPFDTRPATPAGTGPGVPGPGVPGPGGPGYRPMPGIPGGPGGTAGTDTEAEVPDYCLVRVIDVTVQPGHTYEYRLQIRMANPNYSRKDVSSPTYAQDRELLSDWTAMPIQVTVDPELHYYAVDMANFDAKYDGPYARGDFKKDKVVMLQAHKWLDSIITPLDKKPVFIGEWGIAERFPVYRGEYIGRTERVQVPYWRYTEEKFILAVDPRIKRGRPGIEVNFGFGRSDRTPPEAILVDFTPSRANYDRVVKRTEDKVETRRITEDAAVEVLMLSPDGKLLARNGAEDVFDEERVARRDAVRKRIKEVKEDSGSPDKTAAPKKPFGD